MQPLDDAGRRWRLRLAVVACVSALLLLPLALRPAVALHAVPRVGGVALRVWAGHRAAPDRRIALSRDPFVPLVRSQKRIFALGAQTGDLQLVATSVGDHARALLAFGGKIVVVRSGQRLLGTRVLSIGRGSIVLADGRRLTFVAAQR
ncbi:MAG: hypothetical protein ACYDA5_03010 [Vulcanimicrobiaceae bacterium]